MVVVIAFPPPKKYKILRFFGDKITVEACLTLTLKVVLYEKSSHFNVQPLTV
jgi:hypothetical protein